jgi:hypothetical protein
MTTNLKDELFAAWKAEHPVGTLQEFDEEWLAKTNEARPGIFVANPTSSSWDQDPVVIKRRMFEEWRASRPDGTHEQFEAEWSALTASG